MLHCYHADSGRFENQCELQVEVGSYRKIVKDSKKRGGGKAPASFGEATRRTDMKRINTFKIALAVSILISLLTVQSEGRKKGDVDS
jgi:hypothetical protein